MIRRRLASSCWRRRLRRKGQLAPKIGIAPGTGKPSKWVVVATLPITSRLEGLNKEYGTHILVNESTYAAAKNGGFLFRELDLIRVKGKFQPVTIYELCGKLYELQQDPGFPEMQERLEKFTIARCLYRQRKWLEAQQMFQAILNRWPDEGPSRTYWKRCQEYLIEEPPADWDGVFTVLHK